MPQSLHVLSSHIIFSTKNRVGCLTSDLRPKVHAYIAGILHNLECQSITVGGTQDHVHIACNLTKKHAPMKLLETIKKDSSKWIKTQAAALQQFHWQDGYGLFAVSPSHATAVRQYILNQEEHHKRESFQDEFVRILKKYAVQYDERYLWD
jgi:putative transposase